MVSHTQVLVVGAGPVGVFMAAELCRHGVSCRIIDMNEGPRDNARASVIQPRSLEILGALGIVDGFLDAGVICPDVVITTPDLKPLRTVSSDALDSPFPFSLSIEQSKTERLLLRHLARFGLEVERRVSLRHFVPDDSGVTAVLDHHDRSEETVRCQYLVGCDGAHSTVRHTLGVAFEGETKTDVFAIAEARLDWHVSLPSNQIRFFVSDAGQIFYGPFAEGRCLFSADYHLSPGELSPPAEPSLEDLETILATRTPGATLREVYWKDFFHVNIRQAARYSIGRVFLAGDAAHVQSPAGGQGMNTGMQDAFNLGWKLGLALKGDAPPNLLESYHPERHRAGKDMLILNDYLFRVELESQLDLPPPRALTRRLAGILASQQLIQERMGRAIAELSINYRHSPIIATHRLGPESDEQHIGPEAHHDFNVAPHAGDRCPDGNLERYPSGQSVRLFQITTGIEHHLLLLAGHGATEAIYQRLRAVESEIAAHYGHVMTVHLVVPREVPDALQSHGSLLLDPGGELHHCYGARAACLYLIRPDGYIGFRSQPIDADALRSYLSGLFAA